MCTLFTTLRLNAGRRNSLRRQVQNDRTISEKRGEKLGGEETVVPVNIKT